MAFEIDGTPNRVNSSEPVSFRLVHNEPQVGQHFVSNCPSVASGMPLELILNVRIGEASDSPDFFMCFV